MSPTRFTAASPNKRIDRGTPAGSRFWRSGRIVRARTSDALDDFRMIPRF